MKRAGTVAVASIGLSMLVVGCGSTGVSTTPAQAPTSAAQTPSRAPTPSASKAGIGDTINLSDITNKQKIAVTVVKVVDPDSPANEFETPPAGDRFESIQFRIMNTGTKVYEDDPLVDITAKDGSGQNLQQEIVTSTIAGAQMSSSVHLVPGDTALGFVTFDVPTSDQIAQTQYSISAGMGTTGQWQIGQTQPAASSPSGGAAAPPTSPATTASPSAPASTSSAQAVVEQYFAAINAGNYALAWSLGGKNIQHGSYNSFVQGFADTSSDSVTIVSAAGNTVTVQLDATQTDGSHKHFAGTYTVENGAIVAANIH